MNPAGLALGLVMLIVGASLLVSPMTHESHSWRWDLREQKNWEGAKINAQPMGLDESGVLFSPMGNRPVSLLTPPLELRGDLGGILTVSAQCPDAPVQGVRTGVRLLWQIEERPDFHFEEQIVQLGRRPTEIVFGLPVPAADLHRIGVQFLGTSQNIRSSGIQIPSPSPVQKLIYVAHQLGTIVPILSHSVNFVRGPLLLGHSTNYYTLSLMLIALGGYLVSRSILRRPIRWTTMGLLLLIVWVAADIPATWRFARQVNDDVARFGELDANGKIAAAHGGEVAWAFEQLSQHTPVGSTFAVVSDDTFTPAHRLGYLAAPFRTRRENPADAEFVFSCHASNVAFDSSKGAFAVGDQPPIQAAEIARLSPDVYLLRNTSQPNSAPTDSPPPQLPLSLPWLLAGILVPWAAGAGLVAWLVNRRWTWVFVIGGGWLFGQILIVATLSIFLLITNGGRARLIILGLAILAASCWWIVFHRTRLFANADKTPSSGISGKIRQPLSWQVPAMALLIIGLMIKLSYMTMSQWSVTVRCDDAISMWLFKAKVIAGLDQLPTDPTHDYYLGGSNPNYPLLCPLIAAWLPMVAGQWDERIATLPWLLCYMNLLLLMGGGLCRWLSAAHASAVAYLVGSLPLLAMHVVRPGYADLLLAAFLVGAVVLLSGWRSDGRLGDLLLGGIFALTAACMKREGPPVVALALVFFLATGRRHLLTYPIRVRWGIAAVVLIGTILTTAVVGFSDHAESVAAFGYHPGVWSALGRHLFTWDSFHALFWLFAFLMPVLLWNRRVESGPAAALLVLVWCSLIAAIFIFTPQARFALNDQTPSRLFLQVTPAIVGLLAATLGPTMSDKGEAAHGNV